MQFHAGKLDESKFAVPHGYAGRAHGFDRVSLIDRGIGSVHMGVGVCRLAAGGGVDACVHANEKGIYVFEGEIEVKRGNQVFKLAQDDYALISTGVTHAYRNVSNKPARWFDMQVGRTCRRRFTEQPVDEVDHRRIKRQVFQLRLILV